MVTEPTDESPRIYSITSRVSRATFPEKSQAAHKEKIDDYRRWNLKLKWGLKTHLQLPIIAVGAVKDNEMKIFRNFNNTSIPFLSSG